MSKYTAIIRWQLNEEADFVKNQYSRAHRWSFDGGIEVPASSSPKVVPSPDVYRKCCGSGVVFYRECCKLPYALVFINSCQRRLCC